MNRDEIDETIIEIMLQDGPYGYIDGHQYITEFIVALLAGQGREWADKHYPHRHDK